ncbi:MAG: hypothetical protein KDA80_05710 [Planctomycetaceae bacterium]|nr:hypothetical protein [Planctomycetaceae bacterium]
MSEKNIRLTRRQQEMLLRGLRYVRSSVALEQQDWSEEVEQKRQNQYQEIAELEGLLGDMPLVEAAAV